MYLIKELERLEKVAVAAGDRGLVADLSADLAFVREVVGRLRWYEDRANRSLLIERISGSSNEAIKGILKSMRQRTFDEVK